MQPVIGITAQTREVATSSGAQQADTVTHSYISAVAGAGAIPVLLPINDPDHVDEIVTRLDGVVLTGGGDVSPDRYNGTGHATVYGVDPRRDEFELALAVAIAREHLPLLAICRGIQVLNVALGGTLVVDIASEIETDIEHFAAGEAAKTAHQPVQLAPDCSLAGLFQTTELLVNSIHHQAVKSPAPGLKPIAWSPDGVIEGLEAEDAEWPLLAVQWHPENLVGTEDAARRLFAQLVEAADKRRAERYLLT